MIRTLSSMQTFVMKVVFPAIWITGFGAGTILLFLAGPTVHGKNGGPPPPQMKWLFLGVWLAGSTFIYWSCIRLKRVRMSDTTLYISNYLEEIEVSLVDVADVRENRWVNIHPVTIEFRRETPFGEHVVFMPKARFFGGWSSHPVVAELRQAVDGALGIGPGAAARP
jgi:hypothetical protein